MAISSSPESETQVHLRYRLSSKHRVRIQITWLNACVARFRKYSFDCKALGIFLSPYCLHTDGVHAMLVHKSLSLSISDDGLAAQSAPQNGQAK